MREGWKRKAHSKQIINVELMNTTRGLGATARPEGARPNKNHHYPFFNFLHFLYGALPVLAFWLHLWGNAKGGKNKCQKWNTYL
jgi:hypothetical protein